MTIHKSDQLSKLIVERIEKLQIDYIEKDKAEAAATLAHLRKGINKPVGSIPEIWMITLEGIPDPSKSDKPSRTEITSHAVLTLYALHQQSKTEPMHIRGVGVGTAVQELAKRSLSDSDNRDLYVEQPVRRRLNAAATSISIIELIYHLRGIITQLRAENICMDYEQLAKDLYKSQFPNGLDAVRLKWGRDFYQSRSIDKDTNPNNEVISTSESSDI